MCGKLPEFVAWYKKSRKVPNLTKFAEATMPKGRGRKGSEGPRKRKTPVPTATRLEHPSFADSSSGHALSQHVPTTLYPSCPTSLVLPVSHTTNIQVTSTYPIPSVPSPAVSGYGYSPMPPYYLHSTPSPYQFTLVKISGNISTCAGCRNKYPKHPSPSR